MTASHVHALLQAKSSGPAGGNAAGGGGRKLGRTFSMSMPDVRLAGSRPGSKRSSAQDLIAAAAEDELVITTDLETGPLPGVPAKVLDDTVLPRKTFKSQFWRVSPCMILSLTELNADR